MGQRLTVRSVLRLIGSLGKAKQYFALLSSKTTLAAPKLRALGKAKQYFALLSFFRNFAKDFRKSFYK